MPVTARRTRWGELRDLLAYLFVGVGLVTSLVLLVWYTDLHSGTVFKWLGFGGTTLLVVGEAIRANRRHWGDRRFWILLGLFLAAQLALGLPLLLAVTRVSATVWGVLFVVESGLVAAYLAYFLSSGSD